MTGSVISLCIFAIIGTITCEIPSYIHVCKRNDPDVSRCIVKSVENMLPLLKTGIPEINVPALEPLFIRDIAINRGTGRARFDIVLKNITATGASNFVVNKLKLDVPNLTYKVDITFPALYMVGQYSVDAQILSLPINGEGLFECTAETLDATGILQGDIQEIDGVRYMNFVSLDIDLKIKDYDLKVGHLFGDDEVLNEAAALIIKTNKEELLAIASPYIKEKASEMILKIANAICKNFSYDEIFPAN